jgi:hypothetical protein
LKPARIRCRLYLFTLNPEGKPARIPCALRNYGGIRVAPAGRLGENEFVQILLKIVKI